MHVCVRAVVACMGAIAVFPSCTGFAPAAAGGVHDHEHTVGLVRSRRR